MCSSRRCTSGFLVPAGRSTAKIISWASTDSHIHQWSTKCLLISQPDFFNDDTNLFHRKNKNQLFLLNISQENIPKWFPVDKLDLDIDKTQAVGFLKIHGEEIRSTDSFIERSNCVKPLRILIDKPLTFSSHFAEVAKKLSKHHLVVSRLRHCVKKPVVLRYYNTQFTPNTGYGLLIHGCISKTRKSFF